MRCNQAKRRLNERWLKEPGLVEDQELLQHLRECSACARHAAAVRTLKRDFAASRTHDLDGGLPLSILKTRVEAHALPSNPAKTKEFSLMTTLMKNLRNRSKLSATVAIAVVVLAFLTLVPFKFERAVGYEVAVAGVDKELALDNDRVQALLATLGMEGAVVDVTDCEATCNLVIRKLGSQEDADLVAAAFKSGEERVVECEVLMIRAECSNSLLDQARTVMFFGEKPADPEGIKEELIERLGADCGGDAVVWMQCLTDSILCSDFGLGGDRVGARKIVVKLATDGESEALYVNISSDSIKKCIMIQGVGEGSIQDLCAKLKLEDGEIDEEIIRQLKEQGCDVTVETSADGTKKAIKIECNDITREGIEDDGEEAASKESSDANLPEGFELAQNYPNPFNPTTAIDFSLPEAQHVTLEVVNIQGQVVRTLVDDVRSAGDHSVEWDATSDNGNRVASGVYFYRLSAGDHVASRKMTLLK